MRKECPYRKGTQTTKTRTEETPPRQEYSRYKHIRLVSHPQDRPRGRTTSLPPGTYHVNPRRPPPPKDTLEDMSYQDRMEDSPEDLEEELYPRGDTYSSQVLEVLPSEDVQILIAQIQSLIPGGNTPVDVTPTSAAPALQEATNKAGVQDTQQVSDE